MPVPEGRWFERRDRFTRTVPSAGIEAFDVALRITEKVLANWCHAWILTDSREREESSTRAAVLESASLSAVDPSQDRP